MTGGGLKRDDILRKKTAKGYRYVSKKKSEAARRHPWIAAVQAARAKLGVHGFVPIKKGTPLYLAAKAIYDQHPWILAVQEARAKLGINGFVPLKKGTPLYLEAKAIYNQTSA